MRHCAFGRDALRLFIIVATHSTRRGDPVWQKIWQQNPKLMLSVGVVRQTHSASSIRKYEITLCNINFKFDKALLTVLFIGVVMTVSIFENF